jgi:hypothetical protein
MMRRSIRIVLSAVCFAPLLWTSTVAKADASFFTENCSEEQVQILQMWSNQAIALVQEPRYGWQYERWFGPITGEKLGRISHVAQFVLETLQIANLGAAARVALGLGQTNAMPLRIVCNGNYEENLAHKTGVDEITMDKPFWSRTTDAELASFDSHAGAILHEIVHLSGVNHLPGCNGGSFSPAQCFDRALEFAANDDPSIFDSAQNYEYFMTNK